MKIAVSMLIQKEISCETDDGYSSQLNEMIAGLEKLGYSVSVESEEEIEDTWKYSLQSGDEIVIDTGDNELPPSIIISTIEYRPGDTVIITDNAGEVHECLIKEIS